MTKEISIAEVKKHKDSKSLWIVIHNDVYDVTSFLNEHPGGEDTLLEVAGKDGTQEFEDVGHSDDARELLKKYKIGRLPESEQEGSANICCPPILESRSTEKTWRTFDGGSSSISRHSLPRKESVTPREERRVPCIVVPRESYPSLKWLLLGLAMAAVIGFIVKKKMG